MSLGQVRQTLDDLRKVDGHAELIGGSIVSFPPAGYWPSVVVGNILDSLRQFRHREQHGYVGMTQLGYTVTELSSGRESFSPDASWFDGPVPKKSMKFVEGPPTFAVEVRSQENYGPAAEEEMAAKRVDYFEAGTKGVWDVDPEAETIAFYTSPSPQPLQLFHRGEIAHAEPAVPGWTMAVDDVFAE